MDSDTERTQLQQKATLPNAQLELLQDDNETLSDDTSCGFGPFRGAFLQKFATKQMYVFFYGILGLFNAASWAYYRGTINTMEKRFKIPSKTLGYMEVAMTASELFMSTVLGYWAGRSHRPRWIAVSQITFILEMFFYLLPHLIYGAGEGALVLTEEFGSSRNNTLSNYGNKDLCGSRGECTEMDGSFIQPAILFAAKFIGGLGGGLFYTAGTAYIDDNVNKEESPFIMSLSMFIRMIGPSLGYAVASACLKVYVAPSLTPTIDTDDPRWIGAWWSGWIIFIAIISIAIIPISLFPKKLPRPVDKGKATKRATQQPPPSFKDLIVTTKRLFKNRIFMCNTVAAIMYILGESAYWNFQAKYIEVQYHASASFANFITGSVSLATSATGILLSGVVIGRLRPSARTLAGWNVFVAALAVCGYISYIFINCENINEIKDIRPTSSILECSAHCDCENAPYSPVCSDGNQTYISACHAGCTGQELRNGTEVYVGCSCTETGSATRGLCPSDCSASLTAFLVVLCIIELAGASGIAANFLIGMRCVDEEDKSAAMGLSLTLLGIFGFAPAPVMYGYIYDMTCVVWGKTCDGTGNCWQYNSSQLVYVLNLTAAVFVSIGTAFDVGVWYHAKDLKMFD